MSKSKLLKVFVVHDGEDCRMTGVPGGVAIIMSEDLVEREVVECMLRSYLHSDKTLSNEEVWHFHNWAVTYSLRGYKGDLTVEFGTIAEKDVGKEQPGLTKVKLSGVEK